MTPQDRKRRRERGQEMKRQERLKVPSFSKSNQGSFDIMYRPPECLCMTQRRPALQGM